MTCPKIRYPIQQTLISIINSLVQTDVKSTERLFVDGLMYDDKNVASSKSIKKKYLTQD